MSHTDDVIHQWGPPAVQAKGCRFSGGWVGGGGKGKGQSGGKKREEVAGLNGAAGIMIRLWDLTTAANRCQESTKLIYSELDGEGVDAGVNVWRKVWCEVRVARQQTWLLCMVKCQAGLRGGLRTIHSR